jgi:hypothetical protein
VIVDPVIRAHAAVVAQQNGTRNTSTAPAVEQPVRYIGIQTKEALV